MESEKKLQNRSFKNGKYGQAGTTNEKAQAPTDKGNELKNAQNKAQTDGVSGYIKRKFAQTSEEAEKKIVAETNSKSNGDASTKNLATESDISTIQTKNPQEEIVIEQLGEVATKKPKKIDRRNRPIIHNSVWLCMDQMNQEDIAGSLYRSKSKYRKWNNLDYELIEYASRDDERRRKHNNTSDEEGANSEKNIETCEIENIEEKENKDATDGLDISKIGNEQGEAKKAQKQPKLTPKQEFELLSDDEKDKFILRLKRRGIILYDHMANDDTIMLTQMMVGISHPEHPEFYQQMVNKILQRCEKFTDNELRLMIKYSTYNYRYYANRYAMAPEIRIGDRFFRLISPAVPLERDAREQLIEIFARLLSERVLKKDELYPVKKYFD